MKYKINIAIAFLFAGILIAGCNQEEKKNTEQTENIEELKSELRNVGQEIEDISEAEAENFKAKAQGALENFNAKIDEFEADAEQAGQEISFKTKSTLADLKNEAQRIESRLNAFGEATEEEIVDFREELKHDFREFGKSVKNFFTDNA